jgi:hypothetical protein
VGLSILNWKLENNNNYSASNCLLRKSRHDRDKLNNIVGENTSNGWNGWIIFPAGNHVII